MAIGMIPGLVLLVRLGASLVRAFDRRTWHAPLPTSADATAPMVGEIPPDWPHALGWG
jgi:hypothetical protein